MIVSKRYISDTSFYKKVLAISLPIMVQSGITGFVSMLDNLMIGTLGTEAMTGVSITNQLIMIFNLVIFGAGSAGSIFVSQYYGARDNEGIRYTFRIKAYMNIAITAITAVLLILFGDAAISAFLTSDGGEGDIALTFEYGREYLNIVLFGLFPFAISQVYSTTLRETEDTRVPMYSGFIALAVNTVLNLVLIYGLAGFPALGVKGAAIATVIARISEMLYLIVITHTRRAKYIFIRGVYSSVRVPLRLVKDVLIKGSPLLINELIWSLSMTAKNLCLSKSGIDAVAAVNIQSTLYNVLSVVYCALAASIAIIVGGMLGADEIDEAKRASKRLLVFSTLAGAVMGALQLGAAPLFPLLYNTGEGVRTLATYMMAFSAISAPTGALAIAAMYTVRAGGRTVEVLLFDCVHTLFITAGSAFVFTFIFPVEIYSLFAIVTLADATKCLIGVLLVKKIGWARNITKAAS